jgi:hypothetical protein
MSESKLPTVVLVPYPHESSIRTRLIRAGVRASRIGKGFVLVHPDAIAFDNQIDKESESPFFNPHNGETVAGVTEEAFRRHGYAFPARPGIDTRVISDYQNYITPR